MAGQEQETLDIRIKRVMKSDMLAPFFIVEGINLAKQAIDGMTDEQLSRRFMSLYHPQDIRNYYRMLSDKLNGSGG
jgi:hypothetical protein